MTPRGRSEVRTSSNLKWYAFSQSVFSGCVHVTDEHFRRAMQTPIPTVHSRPQIHLHAHFPKAKRHNQTCLSHKSRIGIFEERSAPPVRKQDLTSVGGMRRPIQKFLLVKRKRYRERSPYQNRGTASPVRRQQRKNVTRRRCRICMALVVEKRRSRVRNP